MLDDFELHLVEDSPADIELVEEALDKIDTDVVLTNSRNGREFLDNLRGRGEEDAGKSYPDLILLDLDLPRKDGFEVLRELQEDEELKPLPVVVLTMSNAPEEIRECYELQAASCVTKPLSFQEFKNFFESLIEFWDQFAESPTRTVEDRDFAE